MIGNWGLCNASKELSMMSLNWVGHIFAMGFMNLGQNSTYSKMDIIGMFHSSSSQYKLGKIFEPCYRYLGLGMRHEAGICTVVISMN